MLQLIDKKKRIIVYLIFLTILSTTSGKNLKYEQNYDDKINKVQVLGLSKKSNDQIRSQLEKLVFVNIFFINEDKIDKIISKYNLVERYTAKRIYPKKIEVKIVPTKFVAKIFGQNKFLVGANGKIIEYTKVEKKLPCLYGKFNSKKFLEFKEIIDSSSFKFSNLHSIYFYPSRRWDIITANNILIKLREKNLFESLKLAHKIINNIEFQNNRVIDLRISRQIITN